MASLEGLGLQALLRLVRAKSGESRAFRCLIATYCVSAFPALMTSRACVNALSERFRWLDWRPPAFRSTWTSATVRSVRR